MSYIASQARLLRHDSVDRVDNTIIKFRAFVNGDDSLSRLFLDLPRDILSIALAGILSRRKSYFATSTIFVIGNACDAVTINITIADDFTLDCDRSGDGSGVRVVNGYPNLVAST